MATHQEIIDHAIEQARGQQGPFVFEQIVGLGEVNDVFRVELANDTVVVRLHEASELWRFEKETWCIDHAARRGVPGPTVLALSEHRGFAFQVLSFLEGPLACTRPEWRLRAWKEIGRHARTIHGISVAGFGETLDDMIHGSSAAWPEYVHANISDLMDGSRFVDADILGRGDADLAALWIEQLVAAHLDFGLTHGDLSLKNAIWRHETTLALYDWGSAEAHVVPHHDFAVILEDSLGRDTPEFSAVLDGYGMTFGEFQEVEREIAAVWLLRAVDKVRWAQDRAPVALPGAIRALQRAFDARAALDRDSGA